MRGSAGSNKPQSVYMDGRTVSAPAGSTGAAPVGFLGSGRSRTHRRSTTRDIASRPPLSVGRADLMASVMISVRPPTCRRDMA